MHRAKFAWLVMHFGFWPRCRRWRLASPAPRAAVDATLARAHEILARHPLIDGHNDLRTYPRSANRRGARRRILHPTRAAGDTDLPRLREGGVGGQFWSVYIPSGADTAARGFARIQLEQIDIALRMVERYPRDLALALTADDIERAKTEGRIASLLGIEGGHATRDSLGCAARHYRLGVRYMTLTHFNGNDWRTRHRGGAAWRLSKFALESCARDEPLGMLVDLSHVSAETMNDAPTRRGAGHLLALERAGALADAAQRADSVLARLPKTAGVVMVTSSRCSTAGPAHADWQRLRKGDRHQARRSGIYDAAHAMLHVAHPEPRATLADVARPHRAHSRRRRHRPHRHRRGLLWLAVQHGDGTRRRAIYQRCRRTDRSRLYRLDAGSFRAAICWRAMRGAERVARPLQTTRRILRDDRAGGRRKPQPDKN